MSCIAMTAVIGGYRFVFFVNSIVRRPEDDLQLRSKHVASHVIKVVALDVQSVLHFIGKLIAHRDVFRQKDEVVYLPPLHIKLGLIKNFVKAMDQNSAGFLYFTNTFPRISEAKVREGVFAGPQIRELIQDVKFKDQLSEVERAAWKTFKILTTKFVGNYKAEKYRDMVADLVQSYKA